MGQTNCQWVQQTATDSTSKIISTAIDLNGNLFIAGYFYSDSISFGSNTFHNAGTGTADIFFAKLDPGGNVVWAKTAGGAGNDYGGSISTDGNGNAFLSGTFSGSVFSFGSLTVSSNSWQGTSNTFLVKFNAAGDELFMKNYGGQVKVDASGNILLASFFSAPSVTIGATTFNNAGNSDLLILKCDASGNILWARSGGSANADVARSILTDVSGNIYVAGIFNNSQVSDPYGIMTIGSTTLTSRGSTDIFLLKYDANGNLLWAKGAGGTVDDYVHGMESDAAGNLYFTGWTGNYAMYFGNTLFNFPNNYYASNLFLVKYSSGGDLQWIKNSEVAAGGYAYGYAISVDPANNIYIGGSVGGQVQLGTAPLTPVGYNDMFVAKYNSAGTLLWARNNGGADYDDIRTLSTDNSGNIYATGTFSGTASFNLGSGSCALSTSLLYGNTFIAKYSQGVLPLQLASFDGFARNHENILEWETMSEQNLSGFEVQRRGNGNAFQTLSFVASKSPGGNSSEKIKYNYTDASPLNGRNYYRLRSVNKDGSYSFSKIISLSSENSGVLIAPNPVYSTLSVSITVDADGETEFCITDLAGRSIIYSKLSLKKGENSFNASIVSLPKGSYFLRTNGQAIPFVKL